MQCTPMDRLAAHRLGRRRFSLCQLTGMAAMSALRLPARGPPARGGGRAHHDRPHQGEEAELEIARIGNEAEAEYKRYGQGDPGDGNRSRLVIAWRPRQ